MKRDTEKPPKGVYRKSDKIVPIPCSEKELSEILKPENWERGWREWNKLNGFEDE